MFVTIQTLSCPSVFIIYIAIIKEWRGLSIKGIMYMFQIVVKGLKSKCHPVVAAVTRAVVINWPGQAQQLLQEIKRILKYIRENIRPNAGMT